jgi:enhancing lycopene biosynthesis protein 2
MKKIGVILAGCGVYDGSEIHEAVLTLLALDREGATAVCFAPDMEQLHVINHLTGEIADGEKRNVLVESARIARGNITDLKQIDPSELDALIIPGGFGVAKNLCDYADKGAGFEVDPDVTSAVRSFHQAGKPLGFMCISPVIAARLLGSEKVELTVGNDPATATDIESFGARHVDRHVDEITVDIKNRVVSTPAYMLGPTIAEVAKGIDALVRKVIKLC